MVDWICFAGRWLTMFIYHKGGNVLHKKLLLLKGMHPLHFGGVDIDVDVDGGNGSGSWLPFITFIFLFMMPSWINDTYYTKTSVKFYQVELQFFSRLYTFMKKVPKNCVLNPANIDWYYNLTQKVGFSLEPYFYIRDLKFKDE